MKRDDSRDAGERQRSFGRHHKTRLALAAAVILPGYVLLYTPPADGFLSLTAAPLLLVLGYCVLVPVAILAKGHSRDGGKSK